MRRLLPLTVLLTLNTAPAATLADQLPSGALLTVETHEAGGALGRLAGLAGRVMKAVLGEEADHAVSGIAEVLKGSVGKEAALGVFTVGQAGGTFAPHVLGVSRVDDLSTELFRSMLPSGSKGARVGRYTFARQGDMYAGLSGGLVYFSTDKTLLMQTLGRLSGKAAPRLMDSAAYTTPTRATGPQEIRLFLNFSAAAKVVRAELAQLALPRLFSPLVDALDTLGQYAGGFATTPSGLNTASAHAVNAQGKDQPLARILRWRTDFHVQEVIPASAESVQVKACSPESGAYLGRWLSRIDLIDPVGFLTDSQLASHLERSGRYLGSECAQVGLAGSNRASYSGENPLAVVASTVSYQRVTDRAAAEAHLPEYASSVNSTLADLSAQLRGILSRAAREEGRRDLMDEQSLKTLDALGHMKMVYAFRGDYLVTAFSEQALQAALAQSPVLAQDAAFRAAALPVSGSGWTYVRNLPDVTPEELRGVMTAGLPQDMANGGEVTDIFGAVAPVLADLINRYDGQTGWSDVKGDLVLSKGQIRYRW
ncbi:hypothetical protein ACFSR9_07820 [Deinococcus taklimakanensis]|uniref:DUF3352 domain-containing protein n=1 Tax=Deinococcus taklimakanensis TaxID=536443 RepID=A0ABW5P2U8_9DEIO